MKHILSINGYILSLTRRVNGWCIVISCTITTFACHSNLDLVATNGTSDKNFVTLEQARTSALRINQPMPATQPMMNTQSTDIERTNQSTGKSAISLLSGRSVESITPYPTVQNPSFYIINYTSAGFLILSADRRVEPILAYSTQNRFQLSEEMPGGLTLWMSKNHQNMQRVRGDSTLKISAKVAYLWSNLLADSTFKLSSDKALTPQTSGLRPNMQQPPPPPCQDFNYPTITYGPYVSVQWGQGCTYNDQCPGGNYCGSRAAAGCVATAFSQVMYKFQYPSGFNWSTMSDGSSGGNADVQYLLFHVGLSVDMVYTSNTESYPGVAEPDVATRIKQRAGYSSVDYGNYDFNTVVNNIGGNHWPVILNAWTGPNKTGYGHSWVCDGTQTYGYFSCDCQCTYRMTYLHMNWGWNETFTGGNNSNGWYYNTNWDITGNGSGSGYDFDYSQTMYYNIHP